MTVIEEDLHQRLGSTVVIVTHDMKVAASCERTVALRDGRIVEDTRRREPGIVGAAR